MKNWNLVFVQKSMFVLLLISIMSVTSVAYSQESQLEPGIVESNKLEKENVAPAYEAWMLAVRYKFEEIPEGYSITQDPKMKAIASLRGDNLHYFLDSLEAINQVQAIMFPPSSPDSQKIEGIPISEERKLVGIVTNNVFTERSDGMKGLSEQDLKYITELQAILNAIIKGNGDKYFTAQYLEYRTEIVPFIEDTGAELLNPSQKAVDRYLKYFDIDNEQAVDLDPNRTSTKDSCPTTNTSDNWPSKSSTYSGNTGSSWYEGKESSQSDCDIWVRYYMGSTPHYGQVSANTSSAQCVLDKTPQLAADWIGNFNNVQYGKVRVTWWWPIGCNTTGNALRGATKWRP